MKWVPISESKLWDDINNAFDRMSLEQRKYWEVLKITPENWKLDPWGADGGGFWVVAIIGNQVIWFNDIEDGYNTSTYIKYGVINEYTCDQNELEWEVQNIITKFKNI